MLFRSQIFNLKAGSTQIVRVGIAKKPEGPLELAYRLILEEIPPPPAPDFRGLQVALRISMPIFIKPETAAFPDLKVTTENPRTDAGREIRLNFLNKGNAHLHLLGLRVFSPDDLATPSAIHENNIYLLPGQRKTLILTTKTKITPENVLIKASTPYGMMEFHAKPESP